MGYYTIFKLSVFNDDFTESMKEELNNINSEYFYGDSRIDELLEGDFKAKWYNFEEDMKKLSLKFPNNRFVLEGIGEEDTDRWIAYFVNGKMQYEKANITITFGEFNPNKLI